MEDGIIVPQIDTNAGIRSNEPAPAVSALTGNNMVDLANIAKEMGVSLDQNGNVATNQPKAQPAPVTPTPVPVQAAPAKVEAPVEVPAKFQNPDGTVNEQKLEKSTKSVEEMLAYYREKEREAQQLQNRVNNPPAQAQTAPQVNNAPVAQGLNLSPFERQAAIDILNDAAALGIQMTEQQAILQARADIRMAEAKYHAEKSSVADIRAEIEENKRQRELESLLSTDPDLMTPQVADRILEIKKQRGFPTYREAYVHHLGEQEIAKRTGQVKTPTPTGLTAKAPATPVGPVSRVQATLPKDANAMSDAELEAAVRAAYPRYKGINK